jgi:hypothetical protein
VLAQVKWRTLHSIDTIIMPPPQTLHAVSRILVRIERMSSVPRRW